MTTAAQIVAVARGFLGVRFLHQGRSAAGLDCLGLLLLTAEHAGLRFDGIRPLALDTPTYGTRPDTQLLGSKLGACLRPVNAPEPGDILLLRVDGRAQHLAMVTELADARPGMIHAYAPTRRVVEHGYDAQWQGATHAVFRLPHLADREAVR